MKKAICIQLFLALFFIKPAFCQEDTTETTTSVVDTLHNDFGLFSSDEILKLSLRFDITNYRKKKPKEEYMKAVLTYHISDKDSINKDIRLKSRGVMRNEFCSFPPLSLNFKKSNLQKDDLKNIEKIKLVTHCQNGNEENILKEFLVYKLYNILTNNSFRVRLVQISYIDTYKKNKPINSYAFLIEPEDLLAERINVTPLDLNNLNQKSIVPEIMDRVAIFNYMIGNTDWSIPNQHNCKIMRQNNIIGNDLGVLVPYDFDYSGLVDASYAVPTAGLGTESVRERVYVGICRSEDVFINAMREFSDKKDEFYKVINEFPLIGTKTKKEMVKYLDSFYKGFDSRYSIVKNILSGCKNY